LRVKDFLRSVLIFLRIDATKNLEYDRRTKIIIKKVIRQDAVCIDIGCHKGELLEMFMQQAPIHKHFAFEPIPVFYDQLIKKYGHKATIFPYALSDKNEKSTFQYVKNAPAFSGIKQRKYDVARPEIEEIQIDVKKLDDVIPLDAKIDFIKIDVEGGEFGVLLGAKNLLLRNKPIVIFECGLGASDYYNTKPEALYQYLSNEIGLKINSLRGFIQGADSLSEKGFVNIFAKNSEYYFIAYP
jgi:FkbM family methyltransferase